VELEGFVPAPYVGRYKWVSLERLNVLPGAELKGLIEQSYGMVAAKAKIGTKTTHHRGRRAHRAGKPKR
jgi:predicted DNA-binding protein (MmcQ/YjbR family)